jgi:methyl-accepting chemotaxis protein
LKRGSCMGLKLFSKSKQLAELHPSTNENELNGQLQVSVDQLNGVVEQIKLATESLEHISSENQQSVQQLRTHSEQTNTYTMQLNDKVTAIEASSQEVASISEQVLAESITSMDHLQTTFSSLNSLNEKIDYLHNGQQHLIKQMEKLVQQSDETMKIIQSIGAISQKTKILALNASIEAARAGIHGKGFNVVATEVGNLANLTTSAVEDTTKSIRQMQQEILISTKMVQQEASQIQIGTEQVTEVVQRFTELQNAFHHIRGSIEHTNEQVLVQTTSITEISTILQDISAMSVGNVEEVSDISLSLDKQHEEVGVIVQIASSLTTMAEDLQHLVKTNQTIIEIDEGLIAQSKLRLQQLSGENALLSLNLEEHQQLLTAFQKENYFFEAIWTNRTDGTFIFSLPAAGLLNAKARPWFKHAIGGEVYVSEPYTSAVTKRQCITISMPIKKNGVICAVLGADLTI